MAKATKTVKAARNSKRAATNATKRTRVVKASPATVPGYDSVKLIVGKGCNDRTIAAIVPVNRNNDDAALLNDGSLHVVTKHQAAGIAVKAGLQWDIVNNALLALQRAGQEKQPAKLARGVEGKFTEHSRKAAADGRKAAAPAKATKADKKAERKAARAAKAAPKADDTRRITIADKKFSFGGEGTARRTCWDVAVAVAKAKGTVADYIGKGGKAKYLPRWVSAGGIKLA